MEHYISVLIPLFWVVIGVGIALAVFRGLRKRRLKAVLSPLAGAADAYNEALIGRTGTTELNEALRTSEQED